MSTNYWPKYSSSLHDYLADLDVSVFYGKIEIIKDKISRVTSFARFSEYLYFTYVAVYVTVPKLPETEK